MPIARERTKGTGSDFAKLSGKTHLRHAMRAEYMANRIETGTMAAMGLLAKTKD